MSDMKMEEQAYLDKLIERYGPPKHPQPEPKEERRAQKGELMSQLHTINGTTFIVTRQKLREVFPYSRTNPLLWFGFDMRTRDVVCTGTLTKRECLEILQELSAHQRDVKEEK